MNPCCDKSQPRKYERVNYSIIFSIKSYDKFFIARIMKAAIIFSKINWEIDLRALYMHAYTLTYEHG